MSAAPLTADALDLQREKRYQRDLIRARINSRKKMAASNLLTADALDIQREKRFQRDLIRAKINSRNPADRPLSEEKLHLDLGRGQGTSLTADALDIQREKRFQRDLIRARINSRNPADRPRSEEKLHLDLGRGHGRGNGGKPEAAAAVAAAPQGPQFAVTCPAGISPGVYVVWWWWWWWWWCARLCVCACLWVFACA